MQVKEKIRPFDIIVGLKNISYLEKLLLFKINNLDNDKDGCYARDEWFADLFGVHPKSINRCIANLEKNGLIVKQHPDGKRKIKVVLPSRLNDEPYQPNGYQPSNPRVTANQPTGYLPSNRTVDYNTKDITKEKTKEREYSSHADFIINNYKNEVDELRKKLIMKEPDFNTFKDFFNESCSKQNLRIEQSYFSEFKRKYANWHRNIKQDEQTSQRKRLDNLNSKPLPSPD